jgi:hypothetical protein
MVPTDAPLQGLVVLGHLLGQHFDTEDALYQALYSTSNGIACQTVPSDRGGNSTESDDLALETAAAYRERVVLISSFVVICTLLLGVIAYLSYQVQKMQTQVRQSGEIGMVQFNPIGGAASNGDRGVNLPYTPVRAQDEEDARH